LRTVSGISDILALTIMLEVGDIGCFAKVGNFASYYRCVSSQRLSDGKRKGSGNYKNVNRYLCWAFAEASPTFTFQKGTSNRFRIRAL
jgi:transposase